MAITITAFAPKGQPIHTTAVATMRDARTYCALWDANSLATMALKDSRYAELRALPE